METNQVQICEKCNGPMISGYEHRKFVLNCNRCQSVYVIEEGNVISLARFLDPWNLIDFDDISHFPPEFQMLFAHDQSFIRQQQSFQPLFRKGFPMMQGITRMGAYEPWENLMVHYRQKMDSEMVIHCIYQAMKDYSWSPNFWNIMGRSLIKFHYWIPAQKCFEMMKLCGKLEGMDSFPLEDCIFRFERFSNKVKQMAKLIYPDMSENAQKCAILNNLRIYSEEFNRNNLAQIHLEKAKKIESNAATA
ncbi:MAG: hypothetical protein ACTSRK_20795 [Promethearchaeota archaeon]